MYIYIRTTRVCRYAHSTHSTQVLRNLYPAMLRPRTRHQTHRPTRHTHALLHTHTPVAIDLHFLHRHTATPATHTQIYRSAHDSPLGRRKCMCTAAHRRPVCSCVDRLAHRCRDGLCGHPGAVHTRTHTRARAGENRGSFH